MILHPYWPLVPGSYIVYQVFDIEGTFDAATGYFGITKRTPHANSPQQCTVLQRGALQGRCFHTPGTPAVIKPGNTIYQARWGSDVTEAAGTKCAQGSGIPLLSDTMTPGHIVSGVLPITHFDNDGEPSEFGEYHWKRYTHHVGQPWASWPDTIRTCLLENLPGQKQIPIAYVFAKGIGAVDYWLGELQADGKTILNGNQFYCIGHG